MTPDFKNNFEATVLKVACLIALTRSIIEVINDLIAEELQPNFYLDLAFIIVFSIGIASTYVKIGFKKLLFLFYLPLITLLCIMFIDGVGLAHSIENNLFGGLVILTFTTRGRVPFFLNATLIICIVFCLIYLGYQYNLLATFEILSSGKLNFVFSTIGIIAFILYAKSVFTRNKSRLASTIDSLNQQTQSLERKREELIEKKKTLDTLTIELNDKVMDRSRELRTHQSQVEEYLSVTMTELFDAYQDTIDAVDRFEESEGKDQMASMVVQSGANLRKEMESLRSKISESL
ncbi:MAG: hypothetical protein HRT61_02715 [Ekhidna sp.]|nr:hypothetical protein [Ekhidna sp.]